MKARKASVLLGAGIASSAALIAAASTASAAPAAYASTASATAGSLNFGDGPPGPANTSLATNARPSAGTTSGIYHGDLPNGAGSFFATHNLDLLTTHAQVYPNGMSTACSAAVSGDCGRQPAPIDLQLNVAKLVTFANSIGGNWVPISDIASTFPDPLNQYTIVLGVTGPQATCEAGPIGGPSGDFKASQSLITGTVDFLQNGKSLIGGPKTIGGSGDLVSPISKILPVLGSAAVQGLAQDALQTKNLQEKAVADGLAALDKAVHVTAAYTPGSASPSGKGPVTSAQAATFSVTVNNFKAFTLTGGKVSCGPNQEIAAATSASPASAPSQSTAGLGTGSAGTSPASTMTSTSSEAPLRSIQTDEGRSGAFPVWTAWSLSPSR